MQVSIITINYNSSEYTIKLVKSIFDKVSSNIEYEIIITDNQSKNDDYKNLVENLPIDSRVKVLRSNINTGFAGGNMNGYLESCGKYLLFINNDCECLNDILHPLVTFIKNNNSVGLLTGKVHGKDGKYAGSHCLFPCLSKSIFGTEMCRFLNKNKFVSPKKPVTKPIKVEVVSGAFMFFDRDVFKSISGFDTDFFLDCEEEDISKRVWNAGKEVYMNPEAKIFHVHGGSKDSGHDIANEYYISYKKLIYKHYGFFYSRIMMMLMYLNILGKVVRLKARPSLVKLALMGFPEKRSLRYKQKEQL
tara:strand:+ start:319 stop:1230 length:912 start_codon:yes stop_codon:yes gene_type:complete